MTDAEKLRTASDFASLKHAGQKRIGGEDYFSHPEAVANMLREKGYGVEHQIAGLFHDLLEDTDATESEIEEIGGKEVLEAVKLLTKTHGYVMADYVAGIKSNGIAFAVKAADRLHNLRCAVICDDTFKRRYIAETKEWYLDFCPEMVDAVRELEESMS